MASQYCATSVSESPVNIRVISLLRFATEARWGWEECGEKRREVLTGIFADQVDEFSGFEHGDVDDREADDVCIVLS